MFGDKIIMKSYSLLFMDNNLWKVIYKIYEINYISDDKDTM